MRDGPVIESISSNVRIAIGVPPQSDRGAFGSGRQAKVEREHEQNWEKRFFDRVIKRKTHFKGLGEGGFWIQKNGPGMGRAVFCEQRIYCFEINTQPYFYFVYIDRRFTPNLKARRSKTQTAVCYCRLKTKDDFNRLQSLRERRTRFAGEVLDCAATFESALTAMVRRVTKRRALDVQGRKENGWTIWKTVHFLFRRSNKQRFEDAEPLRSLANLRRLEAREKEARTTAKKRRKYLGSGNC